MEWGIVLAIGVVAGTLGGSVGFGTSILLLPPLAGWLQSAPVANGARRRRDWIPDRDRGLYRADQYAVLSFVAGLAMIAAAIF